MNYREALAELANLDVSLRIQSGGPLDGRAIVHQFSLSQPPPDCIECPKCTSPEGGWSIGDVIREMVEKREPHRKAIGSCKGTEKMNRSESRRCSTYFSAEIRMAIKQKDK